MTAAGTAAFSGRQHLPPTTTDAFDRPRSVPVAVAALGWSRRRPVALLALWRERATGRRALAGMDARLLHDIGLTPGEAAFEAAKPWWRA